MSAPEPPALVTAENVRDAIAAGETSRLEFKSTFKVDVGTQTANRALPAVVAKTICGFLNKDGGALLIGVADDGTVLGLQNDLALAKPANRDGLERAIKSSLGTAIGVEVAPRVELRFLSIDDKDVVCLTCHPHHVPVFMRDGERDQFYVRDGNQTRPLPMRAAHDYIRGRWPDAGGLNEDRVREIALDTLKTATGSGTPSEGTPTQEEPTDQLATGGSGVPVVPASRTNGPPWLQVASRRVLSLFIEPLARSHGWKKLYLISPWISEFESHASITFLQMLKRIKDDGTTLYVVTRPPEETWHSEALQRIADTGRANIVYLPHLHTKLYAARTATGAFAMLGSANFTQAALESNLELGVRVDGYKGGLQVLSNLEQEAANIYRTPGRRLIHRATF